MARRKLKNSITRSFRLSVTINRKLKELSGYEGLTDTKIVEHAIDTLHTSKFGSKYNGGDDSLGELDQVLADHGYSHQ